MTGGLFDELTPVSQDESLRSMFIWGNDTIDQLGEDDL